jgi:hypothetical protein
MADLRRNLNEIRTLCGVDAVSTEKLLESIAQTEVFWAEVCEWMLMM